MYETSWLGQRSAWPITLIWKASADRSRREGFRAESVLGVSEKVPCDPSPLRPDERATCMHVLPPPHSERATLAD
jgi:hypothetical protein